MVGELSQSVINNMSNQIESLGSIYTHKYTDNMNENNKIESQNVLIRFLDDSTTEMIKNIKEKAQESIDETAKLKKTLVEAQQRITELLGQI